MQTQLRRYKLNQNKAYLFLGIRSLLGKMFANKSISKPVSEPRFSDSWSHSMNTKQQIHLLISLWSYFYLCNYSSSWWFTPGMLDWNYERCYSLHRNAPVLVLVVQTACCWTQHRRVDLHQVRIWPCTSLQSSSWFIVQVSIFFVISMHVFGSIWFSPPPPFIAGVS